MNTYDLLALRIPPDALGMTAEAHQRVIEHALSSAESATADPLAQYQHAAAFLFDLEAQHISRRFSGASGAEGGFTYSELSTRLARAERDRDAALAEYSRILGIVTARSRARASGSVGIVVDP